LQQVCGSLAEAHALDLIHRDIKPANIILCHRGGIPDFVKVLDFGLARAVGAEGEAGLTAVGSLTGTPLYMAPEAIERSQSADARTDLYAVGAVGYFLLTGTPVFRGDTIIELCMQQMHALPEPPSQRLGRPVTPALEAILLRCLAKPPEDRPMSAQAVLDELARCGTADAWTSRDAEAWWQRFKGGAAANDPASRTADTAIPGQTVAYTAPVE
jgi:serine/threonine protein kinase